MDSDIYKITNALSPDDILEKKGSDRYMVHTGSTFSDGDEIHIILKRSDGHWILTDEAHTLMWLSYEGYEPSKDDLLRINAILDSHNASYDNGRIVLNCTGDFEQSLESFKNIIMQVVKLQTEGSPVGNTGSA